jgi:hypothetical protein
MIDIKAFGVRTHGGEEKSATTTAPHFALSLRMYRVFLCKKDVSFVKTDPLTCNGRRL